MSTKASTTPAASNNAVVLHRSVSKRGSFEKPRPLHKSNNTESTPPPLSFSKLSSFEISSVENTMSLLDNVALKLGNGVYDSTLTHAILNLSASLKSWGPLLEIKYKDKFDKCQVSLRNACRDEKLAMVARLHLLEIFELRAMNWKATESMNNYYKQKIAQVEVSPHNKEKRESQTLGSSSSKSTNGDSSSRLGSTSTSRSVSSSPVLKAPFSTTPSDEDNEGPKKKQQPQLQPPSKEREISIHVGGQEIKLSGMDSEILEMAESVLQKHFKKKGLDKGGNALRTAPPRVNNNALQRSKSVLCDSHVNVIRAPLFPESPKAAFQEESELLLHSKETRDRRAQFARNRSKTTLCSPKDISLPFERNGRIGAAGGGSNNNKTIIQYDRKELLEISRSELSRQTPKNWSYVQSVVPDVALAKAHGSPLPMDWEATFLFSKKSQYSEHCDREGKNGQKFGRDSRA